MANKTKRASSKLASLRKVLNKNMRTKTYKSAKQRSVYGRLMGGKRTRRFL